MLPAGVIAAPPITGDEALASGKRRRSPSSSPSASVATTPDGALPSRHEPDERRRVVARTGQRHERGREAPRPTPSRSTPRRPRLLTMPSIGSRQVGARRRVSAGSRRHRRRCPPRSKAQRAAAAAREVRHLELGADPIGACHRSRSASRRPASCPLPTSVTGPTASPLDRLQRAGRDRRGVGLSLDLHDARSRPAPAPARRAPVVPRLTPTRWWRAASS